jgi:hypothetical protein
MSQLRVAIDCLPFDHLARLTDQRGVFEHALGVAPRPDHGYCLDDVARALAVLVREPTPTRLVASLTETCLRFVEAAITPDGLAHNRMDVDGQWTDDPGLGDWWGRAIGALGLAAALAPLPFTQARAMRLFMVAAAQRSVEVRSMAFAIPGVVELLRVRPGSPIARHLLSDAVDVIPYAAAPTGAGGGWGWLEPRLRYGNGSLPDALLAAGDAMGDPRLIEHGLVALSTLLALETRNGHLSVTGPAGRGPGETDVQFDQQPIEVAAIADACARAFVLTGDPQWRDGVERAWAWFTGDNDSGVAMIDELGGGYDGLEPHGRNDNRGAESTLAALSTFQRAREVGVGALPR